MLVFAGQKDMSKFASGTFELKFSAESVEEMALHFNATSTMQNWHCFSFSRFEIEL